MAKYYQEEGKDLQNNKRIRYTALGKDLGVEPEGLSYQQKTLAQEGYELTHRPVAIVSAVQRQKATEEPIHPLDSSRYPEDETGQLSMLRYTPEKWEVGGLVSDPRLRAAVPTLLAMATEGRNVTHESWLSQHSSRLIKKAKEAGVDVDSPMSNPNADATSDMNRERQWLTHFAEKDGKLYGLSNFHQEETPLIPVPDEQVQRARQTVREVLRPRKLSPQFDAHVEQPQLPGMEN